MTEDSLYYLLRRRRKRLPQIGHRTTIFVVLRPCDTRRCADQLVIVANGPAYVVERFSALKTPSETLLSQGERT